VIITWFLKSIDQYSLNILLSKYKEKSNKLNQFLNCLFRLLIRVTNLLQENISSLWIIKTKEIICLRLETILEVREILGRFRKVLKKL
jgi:hypothetical protein